MNEAEIHARAVIAAALIQSGSVDVKLAHLWKTNPSENVLLNQMRESINVIYRTVVEPE